MKQANTDSIRSLSQFWDRIYHVRRQWTREQEFSPWFRGQPKSAYQLLPGIYRKECRWLNDEDCRFDFRIQAEPFLRGEAFVPDSDWEWYYVMQHYGMPTRLLDWTQSSLVALYFAITPKVNTDAAVWMLDPWALNERVAKVGSRIVHGTEVEAQPYLPTYGAGLSIPEAPLAIAASYNSRRMAAQKGCFTIHGSSRAPLESYSRLSSRLIRISISKGAVPRLREELEMAGVTESTLFPELPAVAREIRRYVLGG